MPHGLPRTRIVPWAAQPRESRDTTKQADGLWGGEGHSLLYGSPTFAVNMGLLYVVFV